MGSQFHHLSDHEPSTRSKDHTLAQNTMSLASELRLKIWENIDSSHVLTVRCSTGFGLHALHPIASPSIPLSHRLDPECRAEALAHPALDIHAFASQLHSQNVRFNYDRHTLLFENDRALFAFYEPLDFWEEREVRLLVERHRRVRWVAEGGQEHHFLDRYATFWDLEILYLQAPRAEWLSPDEKGDVKPRGLTREDREAQIRKDFKAYCGNVDKVVPSLGRRGKYPSIVFLDEVAWQRMVLLGEVTRIAPPGSQVLPVSKEKPVASGRREGNEDAESAHVQRDSSPGEDGTRTPTASRFRGPVAPPGYFYDQSGKLTSNQIDIDDWRNRKLQHYWDLTPDEYA